jgi:hypothetical protein
MPTQLLETEIAGPALAYFAAQDLKCVSERRVVLDGRTVSVDIIAALDDVYHVCEAKLSLNPTVIEQACRWLPEAHNVWIAVQEPGNRSKGHEAGRRLLQSRGIGLLYVQSGVARLSFPAVFHAVGNYDLIASAFHLSDNAHDATAGSAGVVRMDADRARLCRLADWLKGRDGAEFREIKKLPDWKTWTSHRLRNLIDDNDDLPVLYHGHAHCRFYVEPAE